MIIKICGVWSQYIYPILILREFTILLLGKGMQIIVNEQGKWEEGMENWKIDH